MTSDEHRASIDSRSESFTDRDGGSPRPLPSAEELSAYDEVAPGLSERIIRQVEIQQRYALEESARAEKVAEASIRSEKIGYLIGFVSILATLALAAFLAFRGFDVAAAIVASVQVLAMLTMQVPRLMEVVNQRKQAEPNRESDQ